jgi:membrane fusion protein (multidrug efflux system)
MEVGEFAVPGDQVAEIVEIDRVKVVVDVPERDVHYLRVGDTAEVLGYAQKDLQRRGAITYINELADEYTRTTRLEIALDNRDHRFRSGQIVRARLTRRVLSDVIMIPLGAVIPLEHGKAVYIVNAEHAQRREVELGLIKGRRVQVLRGLSEGDRLIVAGHRYVSPGQSVNVVERQQPAAVSGLAPQDPASADRP